MTIINYFHKQLEKISKRQSLASLSLCLFAFFISISNSISAIIIIFFFISFVFSEKKYHRLQHVLKNPINKSILIFFTFILISYLWSENNFFFDSLNKYAILLIAPFLDLLNFKKEDKKNAFIFFIIGIIFNISYSFFTYILYEFTIIDKLFFLKHDHYQNEDFLRGFVDHSSLSIFVSFTVFILICYLFKKTYSKKKIKKISLLSLIFILILFLLNSYGRTGFFTLIILLPVFLLIKNPKNTKSFIFFSFLFLLISLNFSSPFKNRLKTTFNFQKDIRTENEKIEDDALYMMDSLGGELTYWKEKINNDVAWRDEIIKKQKNTSMGNRYSIWRKYKMQMLENPLFGKGVGEIKKMVKEKNIKSPHNCYILITFEFGIIGLILFLNIFYVQIKTFFVEKKQAILKLIFPLFFLLCMIINDYIIIYNTACFFSLFSFLLYSQEKSKST